MKQMRLFLMMMLISFLIISSVSYAEDAQTINRLFDQGNSYYEAGDYQRAITTYEEILLSGYASGSVYYNLANAYYRLGERGEALLNYLQAKTLMPRDPDLRANLEYLKKVLQVTFQKNFLTSFTDFLTINELAMLTLGMFAFLVLLTLIYLYLPKVKLKIKMPLYLLAGVFILLLISTSLITYNFYHQEQGIVVVEEATVYFEPSETGEIYYQLTEGNKVTIDLQRQGWLQVHCQEGKKGWVKVKEIAFFNNRYLIGLE